MRHIDSPAYAAGLREQIEQSEAGGISDFDAYNQRASETTYTAETAIARLVAYSRISAVAIDEIVGLVDGSYRDEHLEWLCTTPIAEIEGWAEKCGLL